MRPIPVGERESMVSLMCCDLPVTSYAIFVSLTVISRIIHQATKVSQHKTGRTDSKYESVKSAMSEMDRKELDPQILRHLEMARKTDKIV